MAQFEIFKDAQGNYRFRFQANNNEIVAQSEAYSSKAACENGIAVIKTQAPGAGTLDKSGR